MMSSLALGRPYVKVVCAFLRICHFPRPDFAAFGTEVQFITGSLFAETDKRCQPCSPSSFLANGFMMESKC